MHDDERLPASLAGSHVNGSPTVKGSKKRRKKTPARKRGFLSLRPQDFMEAAYSFWEAIDTPVALGVYLRAKYGCWREIADIRINPLNYRSPRLFQRDYAAVNFFRKYPDLPLDIDRKAVALEKFRASEITCRDSNHRLREWLGGRLSPMSVRVGSVLYDARSKIRNLLGDVDLEEISRRMRWGPGATSATAGAYVSSYNKFDAAPEVTLGALPYARAAVNCCPTWAQHILGVEHPCSVLDSAFRVIPGNSVTCVPKTALTDRVIAIEPHMNIYMQLGVGKYIRSLLRKVRIDLDDQTRNQRGAQLAHSRGLATIDLSSASDTVCRELVEFLLPREWFLLLERLRSVNGAWEGRETFLRYEKFSSMGNGFTFELESLIFWALCSSVLARLQLPTADLCVYGDDIIVPSSAYPLVREVLNFAGFEVNRSKSFHEGLFYESCGKHYFRGLDVTPVYLDKTPTLITELYGFINQVTALSGRLGSFGCLDVRLQPVRRLLISKLAVRDRLFGPIGFGDGVIHGSFDECLPACRSNKNQVEGYTFLQFQPVPKKSEVSSSAALPWGLHRAERISRDSAEARDARRDYWVSPLARRDAWWARLIADSSWTNGYYDMRGPPVRFKLGKLEVHRPTYVEVWL